MFAHLPMKARRPRAQRAGDDSGFTILEVVVAISLVVIVMTSLAAFFVTSAKATNKQGNDQVAIQLATDSMEKARSLTGIGLVHNRDQTTSDTQWNAALDTSTTATLPGVAPYLTNVSEAYDTSIAAGAQTSGQPAGYSAPLPTNGRVVTLGATKYTENWVLANCWSAPTTSGNCLPSSSSGVNLTLYVLVVVDVTWADPHCSNSLCSYVTATRISPTPDPTFDAAQTATKPFIVNPGNQTTARGAVVALPLVVNGGTAPITWTSTGLPAGLTLTPDQTGTGATITGTATTAGTYTVLVSVTDAFNFTSTAKFNWNVSDIPRLTSPGNQFSAKGVALTLGLSATGGTAPLKFSATGLPAGLTINSTTGVISGTPTTVSPGVAGLTVPSGVVVTITDAAGLTDTATFTWLITLPVTVTGPGAQQADLGIADSATPTASGGTSPYTWTATGLPDGLSIDGTSGKITGTPTKLGAFSVTVTAIDAHALTGTASFTWTVNATPKLTNPGNQYSATGTALTLNLSATGNSTPLAYSATGLPTGLTVNASTGVISGTPSAVGTFSVTATVTDAEKATSTAAFTWLVTAPVTVSAPSTRTSNVGVSDSVTPSATGGTSPYTWTATGLPNGLSINASSGAVTGTPTTAGTFVTVVTATDAHGLTGNASTTWTVTDPPHLTKPVNQYSATGTALTLNIQAVGNNTPLTYSATNLPNGLSINTTTGVISGTPTATGTFSPTITVKDAKNLTDTASFTWLVTTPVAVQVPAAQQSDLGIADSATPTASGATSPYTWTATGLPDGLSIDATTGKITGTPTRLGSFTVNVVATDAHGLTGAGSFTWTINAAPKLTNPGNQYSATGTSLALNVRATGGTGTLTYSATNLPNGLSISPSTGVVSGTPTTVGTFTTKITVTDAETGSDTATLTWLVTAPVTVQTSNQQSDVNVADNAAPTASGGTPSYTWTATGLPDGLTIAMTTGKITGTPTKTGTFSVGVTATDSNGLTGTSTFTWTVNAAIKMTNPGNQYSATGSNLTVTTGSTGGTGTLGYAATNLPAGLTINAGTGTIAGTPTTTGSKSVTLTVTDAKGQSDSATFVWLITAPVTVQTTNQQSDVNVADSATPTATGGTSPYTWTASGLPTGLGIDANTGKITGTPTKTGSYTVTVTATDSHGLTGSGTFTWTVNAAVKMTNPGNQFSSTGSTLSLTTGSTGGTAPLSYSATNLPAGLSINTSTGAITGTPTTAGSSSVAVTVTDANGQSDAASFTWTVTAPVTVSSPGAQQSTVNTAVSATPTASGGTSPYGWTATGLPPGLGIDANTGRITGTPTKTGSYTVMVTATDSHNQSGTTTFGWQVNAALSVASQTAQTAEVGVSTSLTMSATGGTGSYVWSATGLPAGLSIGATTGVISGKPTTAGSYTATVTATDSANATASTKVNYTVVAAINITSLTSSPGYPVGTSGALSETTTGGYGSQTWTATGLPTGVSINASDGTLSGTLKQGYRFPTSITVTDSLGGTDTSSFVWTVPGGVVINTSRAFDLTDASKKATSVTLSASGGSYSSYRWSALNLPPGLSINTSTGAITGTPTTAGSYTVTVTAQSYNGSTNGTAGTTTFTWTIT